MTKLSVNINKIATLRNSRGGAVPDPIQVAQDCERFGAEGITVHPRPDERHITKEDALNLAKVVKTEYNIEGYPDERFMQIVATTRPTQATLVPDGPDVLTSNAGWDTVKHADFLTKIIDELKSYGARVSVFVDPDPKMVAGAAACGADRIELYTEAYASHYATDKEEAVAPYLEAAAEARKHGLAINAGHDLSLENLHFLKQSIPDMAEVSIGHALIADALYYGLQNVIPMYKQKLFLAE
ncbi:MAG: pyridoxine 5'-phosphate synthase [Cyclobacteriaceae bacterium]|nr:pyridoxine 5'-phosphate synthase [Cyclobacteriaceae bacterium]MCH8515851.1 pyridoxine 5'-phosphate synthase [Cyclobacteriaceae bacterium]